MTKLQRILVIVLVVQVALAAFVFWPRPAAGGAGKSLLGLKADEIVGVTLADDKGTSLQLAKQGGNWVAITAADYPADGTKIAPLLDRLVAITTGRLVAQTAGSHARLQVADDKFNRKVVLQTSGGASQTLFVGSAAGSQGSHVRLGGQDQVYQAGNLASWEISADLTSWVDATYLSVPVADITAFTLKNANGEWAFEKDASGQWTLAGLAAGETLNADGITTLLSPAASLRLTKVLGKTEDPAYGLGQPAAVLTLVARSGDQTKTHTLTIGARDATDNSYAAKSSDSAYYVRVAEYSVKDLVEKKREGFLKPTPTAQPAAATAPAPAGTATPAP